MKIAEAEDCRCLRCGRWPDQRTGVTGDWLAEPYSLCPGCLERVDFTTLMDDPQRLAERWPHRGRRAELNAREKTSHP
jgi:hypothetical protein